MMDESPEIISLDSPMMRAWHSGASGYDPRIAGLNLSVEMSDPQTSLDNLTALVNSGRRVAAMHAKSSGVLVVFTSGETYLATGLCIGSSEDIRNQNHPRSFLAKFCSMVWGGSVKGWFNWLEPGPNQPFEDGYEGPIEPELFPRGEAPTLFTGSMPQD